tara:strand:+ start:52 stop:213 length:162 start_codon:yes stop_codon:yes gene_type:complete
MGRGRGGGSREKERGGPVDLRAFFVTAAAAFGADDGAEGRPAGTSDGFGANDE